MEFIPSYSLIDAQRIDLIFLFAVNFLDCIEEAVS